MIVSSVIVLDNLQTDGRRIIVEQHTDDQGVVQELSYMAEINTDVNAKLAEHAEGLSDAAG